LAPYYSAETKPRWDLAAEYLAKNARAGDIIIANNTAARYVLSAYAARYRLNDPIVDGTNPSQVAERLPPNARMWIVFGRVGQIMPVSEDRYLERWSGLGVPAATIRFGRHVVAMRFDRVPAQTNR
jgi:mannosyltransferase